MIDKSINKNLLKIIEHYGIIPQLKYFQSEVFELNEAIIKKEEDYQFCETTVKIDKENIKHIAEEISDVLVMIMQFKEYYNIDENEIINIMKEKINRQLNRMKELE